MSEKNKSKNLVLLDPLAYSVEDAALVCAEGVTAIREAIRRGELAYVVKGSGDTRSHKVILRADLEQWLHFKRVAPTRRTASTTTGFPKPAASADEL